MDENREVRYQITPKFNIIYELGMPTGKKIRTALFALLVFIILTFLVAFKAGSMSIVNNDIFKNIKIEIHFYHTKILRFMSFYKENILRYVRFRYRCSILITVQTYDIQKENI